MTLPVELCASPVLLSPILPARRPESESRIYFRRFFLTPFLLGADLAFTDFLGAAFADFLLFTTLLFFTVFLPA
ncbi:MAG: hypothetical protein KDK25_09640, partial [Leptospiraceae bacterium]|nr:hypothetical protein [Leptospiraceae bacterium]